MLQFSDSSLSFNEKLKELVKNDHMHQEPVTRLRMDFE